MVASCSLGPREEWRGSSLGGFCLSTCASSPMGGLVGDKIDRSLEFGRAGEGRQKSPPHQRKILIAHVEGGSAAHNSSMTSSLTDSLSEWEGRDEEPIVAFSLVCDWTMNSWVFRQYRSCLQSQSINPNNAPRARAAARARAREVRPSLGTQRSAAEAAGGASFALQSLTGSTS